MSEDEKNIKDQLENIFLADDEKDDFHDFEETCNQLKKLKREKKLRLLNALATQGDISLFDWVDVLSSRAQAQQMMEDFRNIFGGNKDE